jgi:peptide methionine sulfoxide reductase MsrA
MNNEQQTEGRELATLAGGCFWCLEGDEEAVIRK